MYNKLHILDILFSDFRFLIMPSQLSYKQKVTSCCFFDSINLFYYGIFIVQSTL